MTVTNTTTEVSAEQLMAPGANSEACNHALVLHKAMVNWLMHDVIGKHPTASSGSTLAMVVISLWVRWSRGKK